MVSAYNQNRLRCNGGHSFTPENTYHRPDGRKVCRTCQRKREIRNAKKQQKRKAVSVTTKGYVLLTKLAEQDGYARAGWLDDVIATTAAARGITATDEEVRAAMRKVAEPPAEAEADREPEVWSEKRALADAAFGERRFSG